MTTTEQVTITPRPEVLAMAQAVETELEQSGDLSAMAYYRHNEVMILTDTHAISVWNDGPNEGIQIAHRPLAAQDGPWTSGTP